MNSRVCTVTQLKAWRTWRGGWTGIAFNVPHSWPEKASGRVTGGASQSVGGQAGPVGARVSSSNLPVLEEPRDCRSCGSGCCRAAAALLRCSPAPLLPCSRCCSYGGPWRRIACPRSAPLSLVFSRRRLRLSAHCALPPLSCHRVAGPLSLGSGSVQQHLTCVAKNLPERANLVLEE